MMSLIFRTSRHIAKDIAIRLENVVFMANAHNVETFEPRIIKPQGPTVGTQLSRAPQNPRPPKHIIKVPRNMFRYIVHS